MILRILGLELKLRQYRVGKAFCDAWSPEAGIEGLNQVWRAPEALPTLAELEQPQRWLRRVAAKSATEAARPRAELRPPADLVRPPGRIGPLGWGVVV